MCLNRNHARLDDKLAENLHLGTLAIQFENVAWGQLRGRRGALVASATIDSGGFCYDGVMDVILLTLLRAAVFDKPDALFASLKTLDLA